VTIHKTATPNTSLLSRAVCRSLILFSLCNSMSICIDAYTLDSVYTCCVKEKIIVDTRRDFFRSHNNYKKVPKDPAQENLQRRRRQS
jgi:hypothetical protein